MHVGGSSTCWGSYRNKWYSLCSVTDAYIHAPYCCYRLVMWLVVMQFCDEVNWIRRLHIFFPAGHPVWQDYSLLETLLIKQNKILHRADLCDISSTGWFQKCFKCELKWQHVVPAIGWLFNLGFDTRDVRLLHSLLLFPQSFKNQKNNNSTKSYCGFKWPFFFHCEINKSRGKTQHPTPIKAQQLSHFYLCDWFL